MAKLGKGGKVTKFRYFVFFQGDFRDPQNVISKEALSIKKFYGTSDVRSRVIILLEKSQAFRSFQSAFDESALKIPTLAIPTDDKPKA